MKRALLTAVCAVVCVAQTPVSGPDISAWYRLNPTQTALYKWMRLDPPLTLTVDAATGPHLGVQLPTQVAEDFHFTVGATGTVTLKLAHQATPSALLYFFHSSRVGGDVTGTVAPAGPDTLIVTLPYAMTDQDTLSVVYWTP